MENPVVSAQVFGMKFMFDSDMRGLKSALKAFLIHNNINYATIERTIVGETGKPATILDVQIQSSAIKNAKDVISKFASKNELQILKAVLHQELVPLPKLIIKATDARIVRRDSSGVDFETDLSEDSGYAESKISLGRRTSGATKIVRQMASLITIATIGRDIVTNATRKLKVQYGTGNVIEIEYTALTNFSGLVDTIHGALKLDACFSVFQLHGVIGSKRFNLSEDLFESIRHYDSVLAFTTADVAFYAEMLLDKEELGSSVSSSTRSVTVEEFGLALLKQGLHPEKVAENVRDLKEREIGLKEREIVLQGMAQNMSAEEIAQLLKLLKYS